MDMSGPIEIFFSYAHEDDRIIKWHDRQIPAGADWRAHIDHRLERASVVLLFVSPHFLDSRYCYEVEGRAALQRHESGSAVVIPVILRPCMLELSPFASLQALPRDAKPVSTWTDRDEACLDVAKGVMGAVDLLFERRSSKPDATHARQGLPKWAPKLERLMPNNATSREFVVLKRRWIFNASGPTLTYFFDDHDDLEGKLTVLQNLGLIREVTRTNVKRFAFEEELVDFLIDT
jgi:hypothetical protein